MDVKAALDERVPARTVKSCGPGIPVLMPSATRQRCCDTGAIKPVPEESAYKP